jgi:RNA polymerase sigma-70 factor (ECF subfamily)
MGPAKPAAAVEVALSDEELIQALIAGNLRAGELLYDRLIRVVEWTVSRVLGRERGDCEDIVQNAFEQIVTTLYRDSFARGCSLTSWACAVTSRVAFTELRTNQRRTRNLGRRVEVPEAQLAHGAPDAEALASARQDLERVRAALSTLNPERAEVLVLHELNGLELSEIARTLRLSVSAVQSRLSRGRRDLVERLQAEERGIS